ncbi:MAG: (d)CMP kinase [Acidobacteriota bacterium]
MSLVVAIDGPAGVGKSTVARRLAARLGVPYLNTGAMYRALALRVLDHGVDVADRRAAEAVALAAELELRPGADGEVRVILDGEDVSDRLYVPEVGAASSQIAAYGAVRKRLVALQRSCGEAAGGVLEGRDIGTVVFPHTPYKFFVTARPEVRHHRRWQQLRDAGDEVSREQVAAEMERRDRRDAGRSDSPLACDASYREVDTSDVSIDEVVDELEQAVRRGGADQG